MGELWLMAAPAHMGDLPEQYTFRVKAGEWTTDTLVVSWLSGRQGGIEVHLEGGRP